MKPGWLHLHFLLLAIMAKLWMNYRVTRFKLEPMGGWLYRTILSHFCLTCELFSSPCWFWSLACQLNCSEHGRCDSFTKRCVCDPFWMENFIRVQMGDGESNCGTCNLPGIVRLRKAVFETQSRQSNRYLLSPSISDVMLTQGDSPCPGLVRRTF